MVIETQMDLEVVPNSKEFAISGFNAWTNSLRVKVKAKAMKGQANKELVKKLEELFQAKVKISQGEKSKKKTITISGVEKEELLKKLNQKN